MKFLFDLFNFDLFIVIDNNVADRNISHAVKGKKKSSFDCTNYSESECYPCHEYPLNGDAILVIVPIATDE